MGKSLLKNIFAAFTILCPLSAFTASENEPACVSGYGALSVFPGTHFLTDAGAIKGETKNNHVYTQTLEGDAANITVSGNARILVSMLPDPHVSETTFQIFGIPKGDVVNQLHIANPQHKVKLRANFGIASESGRYVLIGMQDGNSYLFDREADAITRTYGKHGKETVTLGDMTPNENLVITASYFDNSVFVFDRATGYKLKVMQEELPTALAISSLGNVIIVGRRDGGVSIYRSHMAINDQIASVLRNFLPKPFSKSALPVPIEANQSLVGRDWQLALHRETDWRPSFSSDANPVGSIAISADESLAAIAYQNGTVQLLNMADGSEIKSFYFVDRIISKETPTQDAIHVHERVASPGKDGKTIGTWAAGLAISPDNQFLFINTIYKSISAWRISDLKMITMISNSERILTQTFLDRFGRFAVRLRDHSDQLSDIKIFNAPAIVSEALKEEGHGKNALPAIPGVKK